MDINNNRDWKLFLGNGQHNSDAKEILKTLEPPPWRKFGDHNKISDSQKGEIEKRWTDLQSLAENNEKNRKRGKSFRLSLEKAPNVINAVNAAIYLRRPLLVTGKPGSGKSSLAYAIAHELGLGTVLTWAINARTTLQNGLYRYDAIARLQDTNQDEKQNIGEYITLGALGTAFLPSFLPRVLLIDEIDKCDLNLPNDLLNLFEEGEFPIEELRRRLPKEGAQTDAATQSMFTINTLDKNIKAEIEDARVSCYAFPIIVMTSNGERDFPPAFKRRCVRVTMPEPDQTTLKAIVKAHFGDTFFEERQAAINELINYFKPDNAKSEDRATDQLLNTIYLLTREVSYQGEERAVLKEMLCRKLNLPN
ncbi:MAG: AAA family ATPase [Cyanobacteria bacterium J06621_8]